MRSYIILVAQIDSDRVSTNLAQIRAETPRHGHNKHQTSMAKGLLQPWRLQKMPPQGIWLRRRIFASGGFCMNKPATPLECRIFMDRFQKDLRFQERIRMCLKSPDLKS